MDYRDKVWYGGDYNPDQWPDEIIEVDFELFEKAHINILTLPVFSWARIQKDEDTYDLDWLIKILDKALDRGIAVCFATSTAVQPAWLSRKYPEILPRDNRGMKRRFGGRVNFCPNSNKYREFAGKLVEKLAQIAKDYDNIVMWHIGNEYDNYCYCDHCKRKFQQWAKEKYKTIENLNKKWYMNFWGHELYAFDEIEIPDFRSENWELNGLLRTNFQTIALDYNRYMNDSILSCYLNELEILRRETPNIPITTNFMGAFKPLDYFRWAEHLDIISWDHYPGLNDPAYKSAMLHDLMRSLKKKPFWLMEQSPSQQNWAPYNTLKRPGELRLQSYQTLARGADSIMYFQMRRSLANCEKFHGALIDHTGDGETRVFKECQIIGAELGNLSELIGSRVKAKQGIVFDWENWWAIEMSSGPSINLNYMDSIEKYYQAIYDHNEMVDFLWEGDDFSQYDCIYAPLLYMVSDLMYEKLEAYVKNGGQLVLTTFSGIVDINDHVTTLGYPGKFREMAGIWVEEIDGLLPDMTNSIQGFGHKSYTCNCLCDLIHSEGAQVLATFGTDFYQAYPAVTVNNYGDGKVYYIGTIPEEQFIYAFYDYIQEKRDHDYQEGLVFKLAAEARTKVEISVRHTEDKLLYFLLNHSREDQQVMLQEEMVNLIDNKTYKRVVTIKSKDALILKKGYNVLS